MEIRPYQEDLLDEVVEFSLRAWEPVFESVADAMDREVFLAQHPDWRVSQEAAIRDVCADPEARVMVAADAGRVVGFTACKIHEADRIGEIYMIAVDPACQRRGIGSALTEEALAWFKTTDVTTLMVDAGGDPGHAAARATYERAGFKQLPIARYFRKV